MKLFELLCIGLCVISANICAYDDDFCRAAFLMSSASFLWILRGQK